MTTSVSYNGVNLSQSRMDHIAQAETLGEAQRMGVFDSIKDFFRGGAKKEAIKQAFDALHTPSQGAAGDLAAHENLLVHLSNLQQALEPAHTALARLDVAENPATRTWSYSISVNDKPLAAAQDLPIGTGYTLAVFKDFTMLSNLGHHLHERQGIDASATMRQLHEQFREMNAVHANGAGFDHPGVALEKFGVILHSLPGLGGADRNLFPQVSINDAFSAATLSVEGLELGTVAIQDRATLTDVMATKAREGLSLANQLLASRDTAQATRESVQDMADSATDRQAITDRLDDPFFSSANFKGVTRNPDQPAVFQARFEAAGRTETLELSDRTASNMELRGARLENKLATQQYQNLSELIASDFGAAHDTMMVYSLNAVRNEIDQLLGAIGAGIADHTHAQDLPKGDDIPAYISELKGSVIAPMDVGRTTLGEIWQWPITPQTPPDVQLDPRDGAPPHDLGRFMDQRA
ncbi:hypothetical protein [Bordetella genomosp. 5]|uniref:hypothetical protein n=1 Tax=Bordetella genomosp. 5 TaxID=1395608 RepID=UPI0011404707|nr:hypothetical protein [Bordetella genomosp. 5]